MVKDLPLISLVRLISIGEQNACVVLEQILRENMGIINNRPFIPISGKCLTGKSDYFIIVPEQQIVVTVVSALSRLKSRNAGLCGP